MTDASQADDDTFDDESDAEYVQPPEWMTAREFLELAAIASVTDTIGRPTRLMRFHWPAHRRLARNGFITWKSTPDTGRHFAEVNVTEKGIHLVTETTDWRPKSIF